MMMASPSEVAAEDECRKQMAPLLECIERKYL